MRTGSHSPWLLAPVLLMLASTPVRAAVPSPVNSTVPPCLVACPLGDIPFTVVVRDLANNPVQNSSVVLDFSSCPAAFICTTPGMTPDPYIVDLPSRTIRMLTDITGTVSFPLRVGGVCAANTVRVFADGVQLAQRALASPDQNGNGVAVGIVDVDPDIFLAKVGTNDPTADMDCDGDVDDDDVYQHFTQHLSHACEGFVDPAKRSSWGKVKSYYR